MTGIFKINNNEVFGSDGTFSGTIGSNATFPAGHILQIVHNSNSTQITKNDTSEFDIVTVDITPSSTSNKIMILGVVMGAQRGATTGARLNVKVYAGSTLLHDSGANFYTLTTQNLRHGGFAINTLHSPGVDTQITYKLVGNWAAHSSPSYVNKDGNSGSSTITVMEVVG